MFFWTEKIIITILSLASEPYSPKCATVNSKWSTEIKCIIFNWKTKTFFIIEQGTVANRDKFKTGERSDIIIAAQVALKFSILLSRTC